MNRTLLARPLAAVAALTSLSATLVLAQQPDPDPGRFAEEMSVFANFDSKNYAPPQATLFVGSSSIRFWPTAERFPGMPLINRGFGGAHISDVNHYIEETVLKYRPNVVLFYAGDNDLAAGKSPDQVFEDYQAFVHQVLESKPSTQIIWLPVKPSLARWEIWPEMMATNDLVEALSDHHPNLHYSDVATPMLGSDGKPMPRLFVQDGLHMTPAGYDIWDEVVQRTLARIH